MKMADLPGRRYVSGRAESAIADEHKAARAEGQARAGRLHRDEIRDTVLLTVANGAQTYDDVCCELDVSQPTVRRYLHELVDLGALRIINAGEMFTRANPKRFEVVK